MQVRILKITETGSTNNYAAGLIGDSRAEEGMVVLSFRQTEGKGQAGNRWESVDFQNLTFSLILKPDFLPASSQFLISQSVALGTAAFLQSKTENVKIKWPNDIMIGNKKVAGILIENSVKGNCLNWSVCGVGVNMNQCEFQKYAPEAVSLKMAAGHDFDLEGSLGEILEHIFCWYNVLKTGGINQIEDAYLSQLFRINEWGLFVAKNRTFEARIYGVDEFGQLVLEERNNQKSVWPFKAVKMVF